MPPPLRLNAVAFISPQNHPILIRTFQKGDELKYHYVAHTSLDVIEERTNGPTKSNECYLGLLYTMDDIAAYGYITPLKVKIVLALPLTDSVVRDSEVVMVCPFLSLSTRPISDMDMRIDLQGPPSGLLSRLIEPLPPTLRYTSRRGERQVEVFQAESRRDK
ncbi:hypothetical protein AZE42_02398 [Rhizopogon vesiculosus]|uniref:Trafficking protein particle complex subunit n=1 Tax=Rhizopogon vesiculosus TaxID=180088 RepID=A0A1J8QYW6_9AGAM|nr:hypothetical protein AZE42_02398 [Rhizopogon vesiculosus]